jgi:ATP-dependent DNA helicase PIF1
VAVTAPTGIAGLNIGGTTIHSFAGIGLGTEPEDILVKKIRGSKLLFKRWTETSILIVDESKLLFTYS